MWWNLVGGVLEAVGLGVTGWGIRQTWVGSGTRERFIRDAEPVQRGSHAAHQTHGWVRRVLHLPGRDVTVHAASGTAAGTWDVRGEAEAVYQPLDPALTTTEALAVLDERVRGLLWMTDQNRKADLAKVQAVEAQATDTAAALAKVQDDLTTAKLDLAVHGLRTAAEGPGPGRPRSADPAGGRAGDVGRALAT